MALPPYFPVNRNEAYIAVGTPDLPATALSKYLGLAWRLHCREALPLLERVFPYLRTTELQQAGDDILERMKDPAGGGGGREPGAASGRPGAAQRAVRDAGPSALGRVGRGARTGRRWSGSSAMRSTTPSCESRGSRWPPRRRDGRYRGVLEGFARDTRLPVEARVAAVEGIGSFDITPNRVPEQLVAAVRGKPSSDPVAEAAVRVMAQSLRRTGTAGRHRDRSRLPAGPAPRGAAGPGRAPGRWNYRVIELAKAGKLPEDLKGDATTLLYASPVRGVREAAARVLPLPKMAGGRSLPPIGELVRREGDAEKGRQVFFRAGTNSCGSCHRVQGRGQWIGPDLSTIGVKYGRDELIRSILSPSAAIGYNFRSVVVALADGRVVTGLLVEETAEQAGAQDGDRRAGRDPHRSIEDRRTSDVSLMPDGLAQGLTESELVDLIAFLHTLRQPVAIAGQYHVLGPLAETNDAPRGRPDGGRRPRCHGQRRTRAQARPGAGSMPMPRGWSTCPRSPAATRRPGDTSICTHRWSRRWRRRPGWSSTRRPRPPHGSTASP